MKKDMLRSIFLSAIFFYSVFIASLYAEQTKEEPNVAGILPSFHITGSNTVRTEYYDARGDKTQSPYTHMGDLYSYDEINLNFTKRNTPHDMWKGQIFGVINGSPYRSNFYGAVPEKLNITREKGDTYIPFRFEMGDIYSYFSYRTLQTSLKGIQLDLQPFQDSKRRHSILISSGAQIPSWRDFHIDDSYFNGISYLVEDEKYGKYSVNFVYNTRQGSDDLGTLWRSQFVYSLAGQNTVTLFNQKLLLEGEISMFKGDHDGITDAESGQHRNDKGIFFQALGSSKLPLTYRIRYEEYGKDFRPAGAAVSSATRNMEGHLGWSFTKGFQVRGRLQKTRTGLESNNPTDTVTYGINLTGPLGSLDATRQDANNKDDTVDTLTDTINLNINVPKIYGWTGRIGYQYQNLYNRVAGTEDTEINQISLSADHAIEIFNFKGSITPGVMFRKTANYSSKSSDFSPTFAIRLAGGPHSIDYNINRLDQRRLKTGGTDVLTTTQALNYRYTKDKHIIGLEVSSGYRVPDPGRPIDYYKISAFWTYQFEKQPVIAGRAIAPPKEEIPAPKAIYFDISNLSPATKVEDAIARLKRSNIIKPVEEENLLIYETRIFEEIDLRQRLALLHKNNKLTKSAIIIDLGFIDRPNQIIQTFERVRSILLNAYGNPSGFYERGNVGPNLLADIRNGFFIRITEWSRPGGIIRFGMPRRLDGQVRMEIQFAESFPQYTETLWSIEEVR